MEYSSRNPEPNDDRNPESKFHTDKENMEFSTWDPEFIAWYPESKTVLDSFTWGNT